jgi:hypothetical protein
VSNTFIDKLMPICPASALKAYVYACRVARNDGSFFGSHATFAKKIGTIRRASGQGAMKLLQEAGLVKRLRMGGIDEAGRNRSNDYQLTAIEDVDLEHAESVLRAGMPWGRRRRGAHVTRIEASGCSAGE